MRVMTHPHRLGARCVALLVASASLLAPCAAGAQAIPLWRGVAPGSETWTQQEQRIEATPLGAVVINVVSPTLTPYLPPAGKASGTGVIIAPGGAFVALAIEIEGERVARWLQSRGIAAFVLKYRTIAKRKDGIPAMDVDTASRYGIADGLQAVRLLRRQAKRWGLSPDRIGFVGFSAGGMVASEALLQADSAARPNFAGLIYGAPFGVMPPIPARLPPVFMAWARDDQVAGATMVRFRDALVAAGVQPEVRVFDTGGHGFGLRPQGTSSDRWIEIFYDWLTARGLAKTRENSLH